MAREIQVGEARAAVDGGAVLIDVREPLEWDEARIPGSRLVPMQEVPSRLDEIPESGEVVVYCRSGARSAAVVDWLNANGRPGAVNLGGGILAWAAAGLAVDEGSAAGSR